MKKSPKAFEFRKIFISFDWLCFQTLRERKNLKRVNELNNAKYQYCHLILKLTK